MKWFKHNSDAHSNLKTQAVIAKFGISGYGFWWISVELVAQQGQNFRIEGSKDWKRGLAYRSRLSMDRVEKLLTGFAEEGLIDAEALHAGDLHIPKLAEYGDEYSSRKRGDVPIDSRHTPDSVGLDKNRLDKNREDIDTSPKYEEIDLELSKLLFEFIRENTPTFREPNLEKWAESVRLMREIDGRTEEQIRFLITWSQKDEFWQANILSTKKLREKFDQLVAQVKRQSIRKPKGKAIV